MKERLLEALDRIKDSYDAYFMLNRYDISNSINTHKEEFALLSKELGLLLCEGPLGWIYHCYDCHYKDEYADEKNTAFGYIRDLIRKDAE